MAATNNHLKELATELGVPPEEVMDSLIQFEYHYGIVASLAGIILFWGAIFFLRYTALRYKNQYGHESWEFGVFVSSLLAFAFLVFTANSLHHFLAPELYAMEELYHIVVNEAWKSQD